MDYRHWLSQKVADGSLDWSKAQSSTFPRFLEKYTLHDSQWIGFWMEPPFESTLVIYWDRVWLERMEGEKIQFRAPANGDVNEDWPVLLVQFERVWRLECCYGSILSPGWRVNETISDAESKLLSEGERLALIDSETQRQRQSKKFLDMVLEENLFHTSIEPIYESWVEIWHGGKTRFLCLDHSGEPLFIPGI
ncbi:MAG: hypothetical protein EOP06_31430 [Proteobacteria bacterium]|nr:MAG: hypothetical protein EOP06_31430 [Pseudomonadota bacterium]